jgi:hypothetical protein
MPLDKAEDLGGEADGSRNGDYCAYCFKDGKFTGDLTMDGMIERCLPFMSQANEDMSEEKARKIMREWFPELKRWKASR